MNEQLLTLTQAASRANVCEKTIARWIESRKLPARRHPTSGRVLIESAELDKLIQPKPITTTR